MNLPLGLSSTPTLPLPAALRRRGPRSLSLLAALQALLPTVALLYVAGFLAAAVARLFFPYPLEVTEGASLEAVRGLLRGQPLYAPPTLQHVPMIYGPVYFYLAALVALLIGPSFAALRLVSLLASSGSLLTSGLLVRRETGSATAACVAAGLLAASYPLGDGTLDLGRVDALLVALLLGGLAAARGSSRRSALLSGGLLGLAVMTKQAAAPVALAVLLYLALADHRRLLPCVGALIVSIGLPLALLEAQSGAWASLFLIQLPRQHTLSDLRLGLFWTVDMVPAFTLPLVLGPLFLVERACARQYRALLFYALASLSMFGIAWASNSNVGAAPNVRLPAYAMLAVLFGLGVHEALQYLSRVPAAYQRFWAYGIAVVLAQFALLFYNPRLMVPYRSDGWAADRLVATLAALPGTLFAPDFDAYVRPAGRPEQPFTGSLGELMGAYGGPGTPDGPALLNQLRSQLDQRQYDYVVLDPQSPLFYFKGAVDNAGYVDAGPLFPQNDAYWLWRGRYEPKAEVYVPRERLPAEQRPS